ncbi:MAG: ATP-binding cassette domain-containing protein [Clostridiaceae bacterium]|nr:ATP-binding cassette domain-containing protein [Clostridiaceae bacterium]
MIVCDNLVKIYKTGDIEVVALQGLDLTVEDGEFMAIIGSSGSGKSTLLNMLGGLDRPSAGTLLVDGTDLLKANDKQMRQYRKDTVGFMWQNNARNLIPYLTAVENVELPMFLKGKVNRNRALELLDMVGMVHRKNSKLNQLSGGEQQRIAMAISIANNPRLLLADEPTGAVDTKTSGMVMDVFRDLNKNLGVTIIIVTHDLKLSKKVNRVVAIRDGRTSSEFIRKSYKEEMQNSENMFLQEEEEDKEELVVVDRAGRLQIPKEYLEKLGLTGKNKLKVEIENGQIIIKAPDMDKIKN